MISWIRFFFYAGRVWRQPPIPAERLVDSAFAAAKDRRLERSVKRLGRLGIRSQAAIDGQIRRKEPVDRRCPGCHRRRPDGDDAAGRHRSA